jgi:hypothetical protein
MFQVSCQKDGVLLYFPVVTKNTLFSTHPLMYTYLGWDTVIQVEINQATGAKIPMLQV